jgi:hypothetical protein
MLEKRNLSSKLHLFGNDYQQLLSMIAKLHVNYKGGIDYDASASMITENELLEDLVCLSITAYR